MLMRLIHNAIIIVAVCLLPVFLYFIATSLKAAADESLGLFALYVASIVAFALAIGALFDRQQPPKNPRQRDQ